MKNLDNIYGGRALRIVVGITMLVLLLAGGAEAATLTVDDSGGADYTKIQDAVNAASAEDTILVYSGTYYETVNVNKQLELKGQDSGGGLPVINTTGLGDAITVTANEVIIDGFNAQTDSHLYNGIKLISNNNIIKSNIASNNLLGIWLYSSNNNTLSNNTASNNSYGIYLDFSSSNMLSNNSASGNSYDIELSYGIYLNSSSNNTLSGDTGRIYLDSSCNNTLSVNTGFIYLNSSSNNTLSGNTGRIYVVSSSNKNTLIGNDASNKFSGGISLVSSSNNKLIGNIASSYGAGIYLLWSSNNTLIGNNAFRNYNSGISLVSSRNNTLIGNNAYNSYNYGIHLDSSSNNTLIDNNASGNGNPMMIGTGIGIALDGSSNNTLIGNNVISNLWCGLELLGSSDNTLIDNNVSSNYYNGIGLDTSSNNIIYNNIFNNYNNILEVSYFNKWNTTRQSGTNVINGFYIGGNFWGNPSGTGFSQTCTDADSDGICDSPYELYSSNIDYLPLAAIKPTPAPALVFAITPNSRNAQLGTPVTLFISVINSGTATATGVSIIQASSLPTTLQYRQWNGTAFIEKLNTPIDMPANSTANFVVGINATSEFSSSQMTFNVSGTNTTAAPISAVNTLTISANATPSADVIMMSTSLDVSTGYTPTAFAVATANVGGASATGVSLILDSPSKITGLLYQLNETYPANGTIKGPATGLTIAVGAQPTFAVFLAATEHITYDPANNRITLQLIDGSGKIIGAQSVAVSTK